MTALLIFIAGSLISLYAYPLQSPTKETVYSYSLHANISQSTEDNKALFAIGLLAIGLFGWLASQEITEQVKLRNAITILSDPNSGATMANYNLEANCKTTQDQVLGEFSLGYLTYFKAWNVFNEPVHIIAIANDNYQTTLARPRRDDPIVSASVEFIDAENAINMLKPSERKTFENKLKSVVKELEGKSKEERSIALSKIDKLKEDDESENQK